MQRQWCPSSERLMPLSTLPSSRLVFFISGTPTLQPRGSPKAFLPIRVAPCVVRPCHGRRYLHIQKSVKALPVPDGRFNILFFGGDEFSCHTLRELHEAKDVWDTIHVATHSDRKRARRGAKFAESPVKILARDLGLEYHLLPDDAIHMKQMKFPAPFDGDPNPPNRILITSSIGRFIPWKILQRFPPSRRLNLHPSMIPKYRGAAPIQWAIADGLKETGVSIIEVEKVSRGYDVGDIWAQRSVAIPEGATYSALAPLLAKQGSELLVQVLRDMIKGTQGDARSQDSNRATEAPAIDSTHALVDWWRWDASLIERRSRAIAHQKPLFTYVFDDSTTLQLHDIQVLDSDSHNPALTYPGTGVWNKRKERLEIQCAESTQIAVGSVKQKDRKLIPAKEWWIGVSDGKKQDGRINFHMKSQNESSD